MTAAHKIAWVLCCLWQMVGPPLQAKAPFNFLLAKRGQDNVPFDRPKVRLLIQTGDGKPVPAALRIDCLGRNGGTYFSEARRARHGGNYEHYFMRGPAWDDVISVVVSAPGYRTWQSPDFFVRRPLAPLVAMLAPAPPVLVSGRVIDEDGRPVVGAFIHLTLATPQDGSISRELCPEMVAAPPQQLRWARFAGLFGFRVSTAPHREDPSRSDAQGRFQIRHDLDVGDRFSLEIFLNGSRGFLLPRTLGTATEVPLPDVVLWRWGTPRPDGYSYDKLPPPEAVHADQATLERALVNLPSLDDPRAASLLAGLSESLAGGDLNAGQRRLATRFLGSEVPRIAGAAAKCLAAVDDPALLARVASAYPLLDADLDRMVGLARLLHVHGDDALLDHLARYRWGEDPQLRRLAFALLPAAPRRLAAVYLEWLWYRDPEVHYAVFGRLRQLAGGQDFGFDPDRGWEDQRAALTRWYLWLTQARATLPVAGLPSTVPDGWTGLKLAGFPSYLGEDTGTGVMITGVVPGSPADLAGLRIEEGTTLQLDSVNGHPVGRKTAREVLEFELRQPVGTAVELTTHDAVYSRRAPVHFQLVEVPSPP